MKHRISISFKTYLEFTVRCCPIISILSLRR